MKRITALFLLCVTLLTATACSDTELNDLTGEPTTETVNETVTETVNKKPQESNLKLRIADPLTWDDINAIPVANDTMSTEELRKICVDYMNLELTFPWQANQKQSYEWSPGHPDSILANTAYGGMPYVSSTMSTLYQIMYYYDQETGVVDTKRMGASFTQIMGNQCSGSTFWGWARVSDSIDWSGTSEILPSHGAVKIGPYEYDTTMTSFNSVKTVDLCENNGEQIMFQSYAQLLMADGVVYNQYGAGHVMMVTEKAVVVTKDGAINGKESYVFVQDQQEKRYMDKQSDGSVILVMKGVSHKVSFEELYEGGYLPFSLPEFHGKAVSKAEVSYVDRKDGTSVQDIISGSIRSNYAISDINIRIYDKDGNFTGERFYCLGSKNPYARSLTASVLGPTSLISRYVSEGSRAKLNVRISTGEEICLYDGPITK